MRLPLISVNGIFDGVVGRGRREDEVVVMVVVTCVRMRKRTREGKKTKRDRQEGERELRATTYHFVCRSFLFFTSISFFSFPPHELLQSTTVLTG